MPLIHKFIRSTISQSLRSGLTQNGFLKTKVSLHQTRNRTLYQAAVRDGDNPINKENGFGSKDELVDNSIGNFGCFTNKLNLKEIENQELYDSTRNTINLLDKSFSVIPSGTWRDTTPFCQKEGKEKNSIPKAFQLRTMEDSWLDIQLNFKDDLELVKKYEGAYGEIQVGKIMEDLDKLAAGVAYKYCGEEVTASNLTIVTASVDRIELLGYIDPDKNYRLGGYVTYVGYSSLEVFIQMDELNNDGTVAPPPITLSNIPEETRTLPKKDPNLVAKFTMVTLNKYTKKPSQLDPLLVRCSREKSLFNAGLASKARKMSHAQHSFDKKPPSAEERLIIHDLYLESQKYIKNDLQFPSNTKWMNSTQLQSVLICQPQDRNVHQFIFGGFLMRLAYNLSWTTGFTYLKTPPKFVASDEIQFKKSVPVGSILTLTSKVCYSPCTHSLTSKRTPEGDPSTFQVSVQAHTVTPGLKEPGLTNTFRFTFRTPDPEKAPVPHLLAQSYAEFIEYLEARRSTRNHDIWSSK